MCLTPKEQDHWLPIRPKKALLELQTLFKTTQQSLTEGIAFGSHTRVSLFQSVDDPIIDPASIDYIYSGLTKKTACTISKTMIDSSLHVFTRLAGRTTITEQDKSESKTIL